MSALPEHHALQRLSVRLRYDPALVDALYAGPVRGVSARQRAMLTAVDRRAWRDDPLRRSRTLTALIDELPASCGAHGVEGLDAFFSSEDFHRCVMERGVLVLALAAWLQPQVGPVAALESAIAAARRAAPRPAGRGVVLAPGVEPLRVPVGTLESRQRMVEQLGPEPTAAIARGARCSRRPTGPGDEPLLVERQPDGDVSVSVISDELCAVLRRAGTPTPRRELVRALRRRGAGVEAAEILQSLIDDGLLVAR